MKYFNERALFPLFIGGAAFIVRFDQPNCVGRTKRVVSISPILMDPVLRGEGVNLILSDFNHLLVFGKAGVLIFTLLNGC